MNRSARIILAVFVLAAVVTLLYPRHSNYSSPPPRATQNSAVPVVQQAASPSIQPDTQAGKPAATPSTGSATRKQTIAEPQPVPTAGGLVAVIDPTTGQLRQADATDIGAATATPAPAGLQRRAALAPQVTEVQTFAAPGGGTGAVLGDDSMSFVVVTKLPDGTLSEQCIDGKKAADAKVRAANRTKNKKSTEKKIQPAQKETTDEM